VAGSRATSCLRKRETGAASTGSRWRVLRRLHSLLHADGIRFHFRARFRRDARHKTGTARSNLPARFPSLSQIGRVWPNSYTGQRPQLHSLQRRRFVCDWIKANWRWRCFGRALFGCHKVQPKRVASRCDYRNADSHCAAGFWQHALENHGYRRRTAPVANRLLLWRR
jgi:hypothetical protein